jgi:hypothetical protein
MSACSRNTVGAPVHVRASLRKKSTRAVLFAAKAVLIGLRHDSVGIPESSMPFTTGSESEFPLLPIACGRT